MSSPACLGGLVKSGHRIAHADFFDTLRVYPGEGSGNGILAEAEAKRINFRLFDDGSLGISLDELSTPAEVDTLLGIFSSSATADVLGGSMQPGYHGPLRRTSPYFSTRCSTGTMRKPQCSAISTASSERTSRSPRA